MVGRIKRENLSSVWKKEPEFTKWLEANVDYLDEALGIGLTDAKSEASTGSFYCDLVAEDSAGNHVVIENQYYASDHDHLGKLLTYFASLDAQVGVWIVEKGRAEHIAAVEWLNQSGLGGFYLVKGEVITIGESEPAPVFTVIAAPSEQSEAVGTTKRELAERHQQRYAFWNELLKLSNDITPLFKNVKPSYDNWVGASCGRPGLSYSYVANQHACGAELYIDRGAGFEGWNGQAYSVLFSRKDEVEAAFGGALLWDEKDGRRGRRVRCELSGGYRDIADIPNTIKSMVEAMVRLDSALRPLFTEMPS